MASLRINALDILKDGVANSSVSPDFKGAVYDYASSFIKEMAMLGGLNKVADLNVKIAFDNQKGFFAPKSDFYA